MECSEMIFVLFNYIKMGILHIKIICHAPCKVLRRDARVVSLDSGEKRNGRQDKSRDRRGWKLRIGLDAGH